MTIIIIVGVVLLVLLIYAIATSGPILDCRYGPQGSTPEREPSEDHETERAA